MDLMTLIGSVPGVGPYLPYIPLLVAIAAAAATVMPAPTATSSAAYTAAYNAINWIALNLGHAKNATAPAPTAPPAAP